MLADEVSDDPVLLELYGVSGGFQALPPLLKVKMH